MTDAPTPAPRDDTLRPRPPAEALLSTPVVLQTGSPAPVGRAVEVAVALDHLRRERPDLLTRLRLALLDSRMVRGDPAELSTLHLAGLTTERGTPMDGTGPLVLGMLRGPAGQEAVENPFVDHSSRALFDHLRHAASASMLFDPHELKAVYANETVLDLLGVTPDASWAGYVQTRGKGAHADDGRPPERN